jgi:hypothetical protein
MEIDAWNPDMDPKLIQQAFDNPLMVHGVPTTNLETSLALKSGLQRGGAKGAQDAIDISRTQQALRGGQGVPGDPRMAAQVQEAVQQFFKQQGMPTDTPYVTMAGTAQHVQGLRPGQPLKDIDIWTRGALPGGRQNIVSTVPLMKASSVIMDMVKTSAKKEVKDAFPGLYRQNRKRRERKDEFAPGIPKARSIDRPRSPRGPTAWRMVVQHHPAARAGDHHDLRIGDPVTGQAHSWATKKDIPGPGDPPIVVYQQPTHDYDYMNFEGELPKGYGRTKKGKKVRSIFDEPTEVLQADNDFIRFNTYASGGPQEFILTRRTKGRQRGNPWYLVNVTKTKDKLPDIPFSKPKYKELAPGAIDMSDDDQVMSAKLDGGHVIFKLKGKRRPRVFSYRKPKSRKSGVIEHSSKVRKLYYDRVPMEIDGKGTVIRGELYARDKSGKRPIPAETVGGMLNASTWKSRKAQDQVGELRPAIFDVVKFRGKKMDDAGYLEKIEVLKKIQKAMPQFEIPDMAFNEDEKKALLTAIEKKVHPATHEGVILRHKHKPSRPIKAKLTVDHDVYVREITQAVDKHGKPKDEAGAIRYSLEPNGPIVGNVGTGFSRAMRRDMWERRDSYKGGVAKVVAEKQTRSGALAKPRFSGWHPDKNDETFWQQNPVAR